MQTLSIIGCGNVGKTLGKLFHDAGVFTIQGIYNRTPEKTQESLDFMGAGTAIDNLENFPASDVLLIGVSDDHIASVARQLTHHPRLHNTIIFHTSGLLTSEVLAPLQKNNFLASAHPFNSFAHPANAIFTFADTPCALEGNVHAVEVLSNAFSRIHGRVLTLTKAQKPLYHTANTMVCNHLVALVEASVTIYQHAGFSREAALALCQPIVRNTVNNIFSYDTTAALTGPVARGDVGTVATHVASLQAIDPAIMHLYKNLAHVLLPLAAGKGVAGDEALARLHELLTH